MEDLQYHRNREDKERSVRYEKRKMHRLLALLMIAISSTFLGILGNVYFHELGHYAVAGHLDLEPELHFTTGNGSETTVFSLIMSNDFKAFVRFNATEDDIQNLLVTAAGPLVNLGLGLFMAIMFFGILRPLKRKEELYRKHFWTFLLMDTILISLMIPSFLSFIINMSFIAGSDGAIIYGLLENMFFS